MMKNVFILYKFIFQIDILLLAKALNTTLNIINHIDHISRLKSSVCPTIYPQREEEMDFQGH